MKKLVDALPKDTPTAPYRAKANLRGLRDIIRRMGMRKYVNDYKVVTQRDEEGRERTKLVYQGEYFAATFSQGDLGSYRLRAILSFAVSFAFHVGVGFINNLGLRQVYIVLPYVAAYLPFYHFAAGTLNLPKGNRLFQRDEVDLSFGRIRKASQFLLVLLGGVVLGELVFLIIHSQQGIPGKEPASIVLMILSAVVMARFAVFQKKVTIIKIEK